MGSYIPSTGEQRRQMLQAVGVNSIEELYTDVPAEIRFHPLDLPQGKTELEVSAAMLAKFATGSFGFSDNDGRTR